MWGIYVDYISSAMEHVSAMLQAYLLRTIYEQAELPYGSNQPERCLLWIHNKAQSELHLAATGAKRTAVF